MTMKCVCLRLQGIIQKIADIHKVKLVCCFGLRLTHSPSGDVHWLHPDMGVSHVREKYEQNHPQDEWRYCAHTQLDKLKHLYRDLC